MMMKKILPILLFLLVASPVLAQKKVKWMTMDDAIAAQKKEPKKIIVDAYTKWCGWCKKLDKDTFQNKDVARYINENFYPVKFDAEGDESVTYNGQEFNNAGFDPAKVNGRNGTHDFARFMRVRGYPAVVFFNEQGGLIQAFPGYRDTKGMEIVLKMVKNDDYKQLTNQEKYKAYLDAFKHTFSK